MTSYNELTMSWWWGQRS